MQITRQLRSTIKEKDKTCCDTPQETVFLASDKRLPNGHNTTLLDCSIPSLPSCYSPGVYGLATARNIQSKRTRDSEHIVIYEFCRNSVHPTPT